MIKNKGIAFKLTFFVLASSAVIFLVIFGYNYIISRRIIVKNIESGAKNLALATVNRIESVLRPIEKVPQNLAYFLGESVYTKEEIIDLLHAVIKNNPEIYGATVAFEPYAFDKDSLYFAPYFYKDNAEIKFTYLKGDSYRYFYWDWYQIPKELGRPVWSEPYFDEGGGNIIMATYSVPFYKDSGGEKKFMGVITADVSLSWLQEIVSSIKIGKTGYGFLVSRNGRVVTHPIKKLIMNETIFDLAEERGDSRLRAIGREMIKGKFDFVSSQSIATGKKSWIVYAPLPSSGWSLGVIFPQGELMADVIQLNSTVFFLGFGGFLFLLAVIVFISGSITRPLRKLYQATKDIATGNLDFELAPIKSQDEVGRLAESFIYMKSALKKYIKELTEATASREKIESELRIAHDIQMSIVPKVFPERPEFDVYAVLEPAKEVGGDFYDFFFIDDNRFCFVIGDVVGKGVPAALFMAMTKTLIKITAKQTACPAEIMDKVNKEVCLDNSSCMFITIFCAILDIKTGEAWYTNAGHNPPLVIADGIKPEFLTGAKSTAIGLDGKAVYLKDKLVLQPGDAICLYTDGVTEAFNEKGEQFGEERLVDFLSIRRRESVEGLIRMLLEKIKLFSTNLAQSDDLTLLALRYGFNKEITVTVKNDISQIQGLRDKWLKFARGNNLADEIIQDVNLALEELVSNIILHGFEDNNEHEITVCIGIKEEKLVVEISDDAKYFNPLEHPDPDIEKPIEERDIGGLGVHIVRKIMDELDYRREQGKNVLVMKKQLRK